MNIDTQLIRNFAIIFIFTVLFGTAALDKWKSLKAPEWFVKSFQNTWISKMPGGAVMGYWMIATIEMVLFILFLSSFLLMPILPFALIGAMFLFGLLCLGLRLTSDFQGSANMFIYFAAALICLNVIS